MGEYRQELMTLMKREDLGNKACVDCGAPSPQWATIPYAVFICLSCAGLHRGLGVHISFVRSITMDEWTEDQMKKMRIGGNIPFMTFMKDYTPAEQGGYRPGMSVSEKYNCWAAAQYKEKLTAEVAGQEWSPSSPPENYGQNISRPSSAQGTRRSRNAGRSNLGSSLRNNSSSPAPNPSGAQSSSASLSDAAYERRTANESYFANLGEINAQRRDDLPPSQGGKYQGFGNTPNPPSNHPSYGMSSAALPTLEEIQNQPVAAMSKGWSLLSAAVTAAGRIVAEKAMDPTLHENVKNYAAQASKMAVDTGRSANEWSKRELGVDVVDNVNAVADKAKGALGMSTHPGGGYSSVDGGGSSGYGGWHDEHGTRLYADGDDDEDFFDRHGAGHTFDNLAPDTPGTGNTMNSQATSGSNAPLTKAGKKKDDWDKDEWNDW
ncbi:ArfGap-domain-containing protein [Serendipita vermifera]|nr:ArfGap-domain-containing protein [Serendipita vermifera]